MCFSQLRFEISVQNYGSSKTHKLNIYRGEVQNSFKNQCKIKETRLDGIKFLHIFLLNLHVIKYFTSRDKIFSPSFQLDKIFHSLVERGIFYTLRMLITFKFLHLTTRIFLTHLSINFLSYMP